MQARLIAHSWKVLILLSLAPGSLSAQQAVPGAPREEPQPVLRLDADGPTAQVTAVAFSPDGKTLYAAGYDKVIRMWNLVGSPGRFELDPFHFRVPMGPGNYGVINALAVSPDGNWIAVGGLGLSRVATTFRQTGRFYPYRGSSTAEMLQDIGLIYLFHKPTRQVHVLRGHAGQVLRVAFAPAHANQPLLLASAAAEIGEQPNSVVGRVRLWDVSKAARFDANTDQLVAGQALLHTTTVATTPNRFMGLDVWHSGPGGQNLSVAMAWGDGRLRVWTVAKDGTTQTQEAANGPPGGDRTALYAPGFGLLAGAAASPTAGVVRSWQTGAQLTTGSSVALRVPDNSYQYCYPTNMALVPAPANRDSDLLAVLTWSQRPQDLSEMYWLRLISLGRRQELATVPLGRDPSALPVVASATQFLAVSGAPDHAIHIYPLPQLLQRNLTPVQRLRSSSPVFRSVAFARRDVGKGKEMGLVLNERPRPGVAAEPAFAVGDLLLDATRRNLTPNPQPQGWRLDTPHELGWKITNTRKLVRGQGNQQTAAWEIQWTGPGGQRGQLTIDFLKVSADAVLTAAVLLPPTKSAPVPILAAAVWDPAIGTSYLWLHNARTGVALRQCNAHTQRIHSLAASSDGRLLLSAADDQTVCLWSTTDLDEILGRFGTVWGVYIEQRDKILRISEVTPSSKAAAQQLQVGDIIEGGIFQPGGEVQAFNSALDYYNHMWDMPPGREIQLRIRRDGKQLTVPVVIEQGVDDKKPLFSLHFAADAKGRQDWIGWSPMGPFDSTGPRVERLVGWHFNPDQLEQGARFAPLGDYRNKFHKFNLLRFLIVHADLEPALRDTEKPIPRPDLRMEIRPASGGGTEQDARGHFILREPDVALAARVSGPSLDNLEVESIGWQLREQRGAKPLQEGQFDLEQAGGQQATHTLRLPRRGVYQFEAQLRTREADPQLAATGVMLRYQPPAPRIAFADQWLKDQNLGDDLHATTEKAAFDLQAQVISGQPGQPVTVEVTNQRTKQTFTLKPGAIRQAVPLEPGENIVTITAQNNDPLPGFEDAEKTRRTLVVFYKRQAIVRVQVRGVKPNGPGAEPLPVEPGQPVVVATRQARLQGNVAGDEDLQFVEIFDVSAHQSLLRLEPKQKTQAFDLKLELRPGSQDFLIRSQSLNSDLTESKLTIDYQPAILSFIVDEPADQVSLFEATHEPTVELKGHFVGGDAEHDCTVEIEVVNQGQNVLQNGETVIRKSIKAAEQAMGQTVTLAQLHLEPGDNQIQIRVRNQWGETPPVERHVFYRRPPRIAQANVSDPTPDGYTNLMAVVLSPAGVPLEQVQVAGQAYPAKDVAKLENDDGTTLRYQVRVPNLQLSAGKNRIPFSVNNADCAVREPRILETSWEPLVTPPPDDPNRPRISLPNLPVSVQTSQFPLSVVVDSRAPHKLTRLEVFRDGQRLNVFDVQRQRVNNRTGFFQMEEQLKLSLNPGPNQFIIEADNNHAVAKRAFTISYVEPPIRLAWDDIPDSVVSNPRLTVRGTAYHQRSVPETELKRKLQGIRVFVNGFRQPPPRLLGPVGSSGQYKFELQLFLNRPTNEIEIDAPGIPLEANTEKIYQVTCANPVAPSTLHLLIVGVNVDPQDHAKLNDSVFQSLQVGSDPTGLKSSAFKHVRIHPLQTNGGNGKPLVGAVTRSQLNTALQSIRQHIAANDVLVVYWLGEDAKPDDQGRWLLPTSERNNFSGFPLDDLLLEQERHILGARVLLLEVAAFGRTGAGEELQSQLNDSRTAVIYYPWSKQKVPVPGLLSALEAAARGHDTTKLKNWVDFISNHYRLTHPQAGLKVTQNVDQLPPLESLILSQK
ncbi:MAG: hypothetical protein ACK4RK_01375 [Gemmataceae bacterium]